MKVVKIIFIIMGLLVMMYAVGACSPKTCPTYTSVKGSSIQVDHIFTDDKI